MKKLILDSIKNSNILKQFLETPILFIMIIIITVLLSYVLFNKHYNVKIEERETQIEKLQYEIYTLKEKKSEEEFFIEENYNENTGKLVKKVASKTNKTETKENTVEIIYKDKIIEKEKIVTKTVVSKHLIYGGVGYSLGFTKMFNFGYFYKFGKLNIGVGIVSPIELDYKNISGLITVGFDF